MSQQQQAATSMEKKGEMMVPGIMHAHLKDPARLTFLMEKCTEAIAACVICAEHAQDAKMDCYLVRISSSDLRFVSFPPPFPQ